MPPNRQSFANGFCRLRFSIPVSEKPGKISQGQANERMFVPQEFASLGQNATIIVFRFLEVVGFFIGDCPEIIYDALLPDSLFLAFSNTENACMV